MDSDLFSSSNASTSPGEPSPLKCHLHAINGTIHTKAISAIITVSYMFPKKTGSQTSEHIGTIEKNRGTQKIHSITHTWPRTLDRKQITRNNNCLVSNDRLGKVVAGLDLWDLDRPLDPRALLLDALLSRRRRLDHGEKQGEEGNGGIGNLTGISPLGMRQRVKSRSVSYFVKWATGKGRRRTLLGARCSVF